MLNKAASTDRSAEDVHRNLASSHPRAEKPYITH